jgi:hypothetical protein
MKGVAVPTSSRVPRKIAGSLALVLGGLFWISGWTAFAESPPSSDQGFDAFRIIVKRSIFDPARRSDEPRRSREPKPATPEFEPPPIERLILLGVLINGPEIIAFFDGSESDYRVPVLLGGTIAGQRIAEIRTDSVKLEGGGRTISLPVGLSIRRQGSEPWEVDYAVQPSFSSEIASANTSESGVRGDSEDKRPEDTSSDDIRRRMMERRKKELE